MEQDMPLMPLSRRGILGLAVLLLPGALGACRSVVPDVTGTGASQSAQEILASLRKANGLPALTPDALLEKAAIEQSGYMAAAGRMAHTALRGRDFETRMKRLAIAAPAAENLAHGRMEPARLFAMWMASEGHRRNMLDARFARYGLAHVADGTGRRYWTLVLGS